MCAQPFGQSSEHRSGRLLNILTGIDPEVGQLIVAALVVLFTIIAGMSSIVALDEMWTVTAAGSETLSLIDTLGDRSADTFFSALAEPVLAQSYGSSGAAASCSPASSAIAPVAARSSGAPGSGAASYAAVADASADARTHA